MALKLWPPLSQRSCQRPVFPARLRYLKSGFDPLPEFTKPVQNGFRIRKAPWGKDFHGVACDRCLISATTRQEKPLWSLPLFWSLEKIPECRDPLHAAHVPYRGSPKSTSGESPTSDYQQAQQRNGH